MRPFCWPLRTYAQSLARREQLAALHSLNNGKRLAEAQIDVSDVVATFDYYAGLVLDRQST